jgi:SAM-dependent methyltransferase
VGKVGWWSERVVPRMADRSLSSRPIMELRSDVCAGLSGRLLEIGFGSGLNVSAYPTGVTSVDAVEPSDVGWKLSAERRSRSPVPVNRVGLDGRRLAAADATYDAVLSTFTLCTIPDVEAALAEVRRVLRPGGTLHVLEHGLAPDPNVAGWQRRLNGLQGRIAAGCHLTRDAPRLVEGAGLTVERLDQAYLPGPGLGKPWTYVSLATAVRP